MRLWPLILCGAMLVAVRPAVAASDADRACEAILCLSVPAAPAQCGAALARYFSISFRFFSDTLKGRVRFLRLCKMQDSSIDVEALARRNISPPPSTYWQPGRPLTEQDRREVLQ